MVEVDMHHLFIFFASYSALFVVVGGAPVASFEPSVTGVRSDPGCAPSAETSPRSPAAAATASSASSSSIWCWIWRFNFMMLRMKSSSFSGQRTNSKNQTRHNKHMSA